MGRGLLAVLALALTSCAGEPYIVARNETIVGPDGNAAILVTCVESIGRCYVRAGRVCPTGWDTIDAQGQSGTVTQSSGRAYGGNGWGVARGYSESSPTFRGTMIIRCKVPSAPPSVAAPSSSTSTTPVTSTEPAASSAPQSGDPITHAAPF